MRALQANNGRVHLPIHFLTTDPTDLFVFFFITSILFHNQQQKKKKKEGEKNEKKNNFLSIFCNYTSPMVLHYFCFCFLSSGFFSSLIIQHLLTLLLVPLSAIIHLFNQTFLSYSCVIFHHLFFFFLFLPLYPSISSFLFSSFKSTIQCIDFWCFKDTRKVIFFSSPTPFFFSVFFFFETFLFLL